MWSGVLRRRVCLQGMPTVWIAVGMAVGTAERIGGRVKKLLPGWLASRRMDQLIESEAEQMMLLHGGRAYVIARDAARAAHAKRDRRLTGHYARIAIIIGGRMGITPARKK